MSEQAAAVIVVVIVFAAVVLAAGAAFHFRDIAPAVQQQQPSEWVPAGDNMWKTIIEADGVVCYAHWRSRSISCLRMEDYQ